ncbi:MAG: DNA mismatch repair protein MutS [Bradymonadia bacterium]|jgi:DNA mismatch repair protein MutS
MQYGDTLQGLEWIDAETIIFEGVRTKLTPMIGQFLDAKKAANGALLLFRMGDFYETFFEDAKTLSTALDLLLTSRSKNDAGDEVPMAGIPARSLEDYVSSLVELGFRVAICDQLEDPSVAVGLVRRGITRVVTPGTMVDERPGAERSARYLSALAFGSKEDAFAALAAIDLSTGECILTQISEMSVLLSELKRLNVCELVGHDMGEGGVWRSLTTLHIPMQTLDEGEFEMQAFIDTWHDREESDALLLSKEALNNFIQSVNEFGFSEPSLVLRALAGLLRYLATLRYPLTANILEVQPYKIESYMHIDAATFQNLELFESFRGGQKKGALLHELDETVSSAGARLLKHWLAYPLKDKLNIDLRLEAVQELYDKFEVRDHLRSSLREIMDFERISAKLANNKVNPRELRQLQASLEELPKLKEGAKTLTSSLLTTSLQQVAPLPELSSILKRAIREDAPINVNEGPIFKEGYDELLDRYREISANGQKELLNFEAKQKKETGISSLKVKYQRIFGYFIEVTKANLSLVPSHYIRKQTLTNCERFYTPELKEFEEELLMAQENKEKRELELFEELKLLAAQSISQLSANAKALAILDVLANLAQIAHQRQYCRPCIKDDGDLILKNARHPVVESFLPKGERFVPNDLSLKRNDAELIIITGPNMSGKSTIIRQTAIIALMAQMGSFVPAEYAHIGIVDRIFSRVGASDNLAQGQSTFMVEMTETAHILQHATKKSLVILDEIGRGTATYDGLSLAWAIAEHLLTKTRARTLFATHYHELTELENIHSGVKNCSVAVKEYKQDIIFLRKLIDGAANRSYGIQVARIAGIPQSVIERAQSILHTLETHTHNDLGKKDNDATKSHPTPRPVNVQASLFAETTPELVKPVTKHDVLSQDFLDEFNHLGLDTTSPIQALNWLYKWQRRLRKS